ncbi:MULTISPECIES: hypothetical protein [unclassified Methylobacterium]|uniref:hypothetical protein n=1 Tax=unclassified Methylobacterium TaxID=2615210 RepID=UPI0006FBFC24|nr:MULTISPECIES: hypothetical protein [unclassified Methylobacterium]KQP82911.1 hypothetical protein ASF57_12320 [Methylobacterium sp. Leaf117]KQP86570.1 hypothetical protein ASF60_21400 [Methylobacterium sp. Leaf113]MCK2053779.1 hypothetical protein [Methylobacterium sp. 37f]
MPTPPSHVVDRIETKAAKLAERDRVAEAAWSELRESLQARDEKTERLKAQRLAKQLERQA